MKERRSLSFRRIATINVEGMKQIEKSPLEHNDDYHKQNLPMGVKLVVKTLSKKQGICIVSKYLPQDI